MDDCDFAGVIIFALAKAVHASESLSHAFIGAKVANEVVGRDVDANFAGARGDEENGAGGGFYAWCAVLFGKETLKNGISGDEFVALFAAHGAGERGNVAFLFGEFVFDSF